MARQLRGLLQDMDSEASDLFERESVLLESAFPDQYGQIRSAIEDFDFDRALTLLDAALAKRVRSS